LSALLIWYWIENLSTLTLHVTCNTYQDREIGMKNPRPKVPPQWRGESRKAYWARLRAMEKAREREATLLARGKSWVQTELDPLEQAFRDVIAE